MVVVSKKSSTSSSSKKDRPLLPSWPQPQPSAGFLAAHAFNAVMFYVCCKSAYQFEDSTRAMAFYGVYHREPWDQVIHFFGVPFIHWTLLVFAAHLPFTDGVTIDSLPGVVPHRLSWATAWAALYAVFYLSIDVAGAGLYFPLLYFMYATAVNMTARDQQAYVEQQQQQQHNKQQPHWMGT